MDSDRQLMEHQKDKSKSMYFSDESTNEELILDNYVALLRVINSKPAKNLKNKGRQFTKHFLTKTDGKNRNAYYKEHYAKVTKRNPERYQRHLERCRRANAKMAKKHSLQFNMR